MRTYFIKEADLPNVVQNGLSTLEIGTRFNHHGLVLDFRKAADAGMTEAEVVADLKDLTVTVKPKGRKEVYLLKEIPPQVIYDILNRYRNAAKSDYDHTGVMYIPFIRPELNTLVNPLALVIGMKDVEHYTVQARWNDVVLTAQRVAVIPEIDKGPTRPIGEHICFTALKRNWQQATYEPLQKDIPFGEPGTAMLGYHVETGDGTLDSVEIIADGEPLHEPLTDAQNALLLHNAGRTPDADYFHVDFNLKGDVLPVGNLKSFRQRFNWSVAPDDYFIYVEMLEGVGEANY